MGSFTSKLSKKSSKPSTSEKMSDSPVGFTHFAKAQSTFKPPLIANENAFLGDVVSKYVFNIPLRPFPTMYFHAIVSRAVLSISQHDPPSH